MGVLVSRNYIFKTKDGQTLVLSNEEAQALAPETDLVISCDGPKCSSRSGTDKPFSIAWNEEAAQKDATQIPDAFFRIIKMGLDPANMKEVVFCGTQCAKDYLTYSYTPARSPREQMEAAKAEQAAQLKELNPHLPDPTAVVRKTDSQMLSVEVPAVGALCQADGYVETEA